MSWKRFVIAIALLVLTSGYTNIVLSHGENIPPSKPLGGFPLEIDGWQGRAGWLSTKIVKILRVDDYMIRDYKRDDENISLYVGFFESQREGQVIHSPKYCMPGSGWRPIDTRTIFIDVPGLEASPIKATMMVIQKDDKKEVVIYWYQIGQKYIASEYMQKIQLVWNAIRYNRTDGSLLRVNAPLVDGDVKKTIEMEKEFIRLVLPLLRGYLPT